MHLFADFDEPLIQHHVQEFQTATGLPGIFGINCIHKSRDVGREQMVFSLIHEDGQVLILKKDFIDGTPWIAREYQLFEQLRPHFATTDDCTLAEPVYLGADRSFHITRYAEGRTASDVLRAPNSAAQANQVFRRAGKWLNQLHHHAQSAPEDIWMNWIFRELDQLLTRPEVFAQPQHYAGFLDQLRRDAPQFQASPCPRAFAHGDFHSGNLILGKGSVCGLDLAYGKEKPILYDVVDFLVSDLNNPLPAADITAGGIRRDSVTFFFKTYRHAIQLPLLNFHLRARLLLELARIDGNAEQQEPRPKFSNLLNRLSCAFDQPLDG